MARVVQFTIPGDPFGKERPRAGHFGQVYTPKTTLDRQAAIGDLARPLFPAPYGGPVRLSVVAIFRIPTSWPKAMREAALRAPYLAKPDWDNLEKIVGDALNGIAWTDDGQVWEAASRKRYGLNPETRVTVEFCDEDPAQVALRDWIEARRQKARDRKAKP